MKKSTTLAGLWSSGLLQPQIRNKPLAMRSDSKRSYYSDSAASGQLIVEYCIQTTHTGEYLIYPAILTRAYR